MNIFNNLNIFNVHYAWLESPVYRRPCNSSQIYTWTFYDLAYLHFRKKLKLSLEDLENDDSSSDGEWKGNYFKSTKGQNLSYKRHKLKESSSELMETAIKTRFLPRRAVTLKTKSIIDTNQDDSEDDNDNME